MEWTVVVDWLVVHARSAGTEVLQNDAGAEERRFIAA